MEGEAVCYSENPEGMRLLYMFLFHQPTKYNIDLFSVYTYVPNNQNAGNGLFAKQLYASSPYTEISEQYSKTQPLANRKLGFGSRDASKTGEFTCWKTTERYRSAVKQENKLIESHRDESKEKKILSRLPKGAPLAPKDREGNSLNMPTFMYDIGRQVSRSSGGAYDPKSTRDCFYSLPKHAKGDVRRLGSHRPSSAEIGRYSGNHQYRRPQYGSPNGCEKFFDRGHLGN